MAMQTILEQICKWKKRDSTKFYSRSLLRNRSFSSLLYSSLAMLAITGSTPSCISLLCQYSFLSNFSECLTAENHTSLLAKDLASFYLTCTSARVRRRRDDRTWRFMQSHTCSVTFNSGWPDGRHTLPGPLTNDICCLILWLEAILPS